MGRLVVYIDDEPALCRVVELIMTRQPGYEVVTFTDPEAALVYIGEHAVSIVICDYRMPALNGLQVLDRIGKPVPFLLVSGDLGVGAMIGSNTRVAGVLTKPIRPETFVDTIRATVGELI